MERLRRRLANPYRLLSHFGGGHANPGRGGRNLSADTVGKLRALFKPPRENVPDMSKTYLRAREEFRSAVAAGTGTVDLLSPLLAAFRGAQADAAIEVPGQYDGRARPDPRLHATVIGVGPKMLVLGSLRRPKRITLQGSDGRDYNFLCKVRGGVTVRSGYFPACSCRLRLLRPAR